MTELTQEFLDLLVCPISQKKLQLTADGNGLYCKESGFVYPVREGLPVLLTEEAIEASKWPGDLQ